MEVNDGGGTAVGPAGMVAAGQVANDFSKATEATEGSMGKLVGAAEHGGFAINEEGADFYLHAFRQFENELNSIEQTAADVTQPPQLGNTPYAEAVAKHNVQTASGNQSYAEALARLKTIVQQSIHAFEVAKQHYGQLDDDAIQNVAKSAREGMQG